MSRTREEDAARLLRRYKEAIEMNLRLQIQIANGRGNVSDELRKRRIQVETRANKMRGTLYKMILSSTLPFGE